MSDKHRRAEFDGITTGWGGDDADLLATRLLIVEDWVSERGGAAMLMPAEQRTITAMTKRLEQLRGAK